MGFSQKDYNKLVRQNQKAVARAMRKRDKNRSKGQQRKSELLTSVKRSDENIENSKNARKATSTEKK